MGWGEQLGGKTEDLSSYQEEGACEKRTVCFVHAELEVRRMSVLSSGSLRWLCGAGGSPERNSKNSQGVRQSGLER